MSLIGARYPPEYVKSIDALQPRYDHSGLPGSQPQSEPDGTWTHYDTVILLHGLCGFLAWQIIAPVAVMVVALGKRKGWWFQIHWRLHIVLTASLTVACVVLGTAASSMGDISSTGKHQVFGFAILAVMWIQVALGYWSHLQHENAVYATPTAAPLPLPKRRLSNYIHIILGLFLLGAGGLEVTWGFSAYTAHPIAKWITVMHWLLAALPPAIFTPIFLFRIYRRMKSGDSFVEAFFGTPSTTTRRPTSKVPPKKLWLGESSYMDEVKSSGGLGSGRKGDIEEGEGFVYGRGGGAGGSQRVSTTSTWEGAETREEYEAAVRASVELQSQSRPAYETPVEGEETNLLAPPTTMTNAGLPLHPETYDAGSSRPISFDSILSAPTTTGAMGGDFDFLPRPPTPPAGMSDDSSSQSRYPSSTPSIALRLPVPTLSLSIFPEAAKTATMNFVSPIFSQYGNVLWNQSQTTFQSMTSSPLQISPLAQLPLPGEGEAPVFPLPPAVAPETEVASPATNRSTAATENGGGEHAAVESPMEMTATEAAVQDILAEISVISDSLTSESTVVSPDVPEPEEQPRERTLSVPMSSLSGMSGETGETMVSAETAHSAGSGKWMSGRV